jgi:copper chaperone for superoxide dismutase
VVRFAQVNMELARIEANFSGLSPGKHAWSINEFGDLTRGAASTGKVFNPPDYLSEKVLLVHNFDCLPALIHPKRRSSCY